MARSRARPFVTIDCETDPFKEGRVPVPFLWGLYDGRDNDYWQFDDVDDLLAQLAKLGRVIVYAHNGGRFDFHYLRDRIDSDTPIMVIGGRLAKFTIGQAEFRDSMNILVNPLRAFSKEEIDYAKLEADVRHLHMDEIGRYLRSDCVNLWETIKRYQDDYGRSLTQAGAAMRYWRREYQVPMRPQTMAQADRYRDYYYGGRVECFATGHGHGRFYVVDKNSAYPDAMMSKHPMEPDAPMDEFLPPDGQLQHCFVKLEAIAEGVFPFKDEAGRLTFPNDGQLREYAVTGWELVAALELNKVRILRVIEVRRFHQLTDFAGYVTHFYEQRKRCKATGDKAGDVFAKLFLNSLYGKFAADPEKYREYTLATDDSLMEWNGKGYEEALPWGERTLMERPLPEHKHRYYNVATAASITGHVRAGLMRAMAKCEGLLYCDTDSIAARDIARLPLGPELGQWKLEMTGDEYAIAAKKTYAFRHAGTDDWKVASKGVRLTAAEIVRVARGETVRHAPSVPTYSVFQPEPVFTERVIRRTPGTLDTFAH